VRELGVEFFEKPRPKAKQRKNAVGIVPFNFSESVLKGEKKVVFTLTKKGKKNDI